MSHEEERHLVYMKGEAGPTRRHRTTGGTRGQIKQSAGKQRQTGMNGRGGRSSGEERKKQAAAALSEKSVGTSYPHKNNIQEE